MNFHQETLPNGITILAECSPHAVSAALGYFVEAGSRDETPEIAGVSHFLEHMAFKGSDSRSAEEVNAAFDRIGAKNNAYTTEEHTVYHALVLPEYVATTVDLLGDLLRPSLRAEDFATEQKVIIEEIGMYADSPMWTAYEKAMRLHFGGHPVGNSVLGTTETVGGLTPEQMRTYHSGRYGSENLIVAGAGKIDWPRFRDEVEKKCGDWKRGGSTRTKPRTASGGGKELVVAEKFVQQSMLLLAPGPAADSPLRTAAELLATIVGDDTGSRFHWALVEPGLVESADFSFHEYNGIGAYMISLGCSPDEADENLGTVRKLLADLDAEGITEAELELAKTKIAARTVLAAERPKNRLGPLGYNWSYRGQYRTVDGELAELQSVTVRQVRALLDEYPLRPMTSVALGPVKEMAAL